MDEINVFLSSIIRNADASMTATVVEQKSNTGKLQLASGFGGLLIVGEVTQDAAFFLTAKRWI